MEEEVARVCLGCALPTLLETALLGVRENIYGGLSYFILQIGSGIALLVCLYILVFDSNFGIAWEAGIAAGLRSIALIKRLAIALTILSSYGLWDYWVVNVINQMVNTSITVSLEATVEGLKNATLERGTVENTIFKTRQSNFPAIEYLERHSIDPLLLLLKSVSALTGLGSLGNAIGIYFFGAIAVMLALLNVGIVSFLFAILGAVKFLISAFGPLIIFAWVFDQSRGAAYGSIRLFFMVGLATVMVTALIGVIAGSYSDFTRIVTNQNLDLEGLSKFVFSFEFMQSLLLSIVSIFLFVVIAFASVKIVDSAGNGLKNALNR